MNLPDARFDRGALKGGIFCPPSGYGSFFLTACYRQSWSHLRLIPYCKAAR